MMNEYELEQLYKKYFHKLYNYAYYRTLKKEAAEDIVSETFLRVVEKSHLYDEKKGSFSSWIYAVCRNCINDYYRKNPSICGLENCSEAAYEDRALSLVENEYEKELYQVLCALSEHERTLFYYKYYLEKTNREIAGILAIPESTVGTELYRARKRIKEKTKIDFE